MKSRFLTTGLLLAFTLIVMSVANPTPPVQVKYPKKIDNIIQDKCYGCHNPDSRGEKSRKKLNWDTLGDLDQDTQKEKFELIVEVLEEGTMPPSRFLERNPDKALTEKETKKFKKWAAKMERKASK